MLRTFAATAPDTTVAPLTVAAEWPNEAKAGSTGVVHVTYRSALGRDATIWTKLPLPPGVELAAQTKDVSIRQGIVHVKTTAGAEHTLALPVRFTLPGKLLVREAETRAVSEEVARSLTPARTLIVRP